MGVRLTGLYGVRRLRTDLLRESQVGAQTGFTVGGGALRIIRTKAGALGTIEADFADADVTAELAFARLAIVVARTILRASARTDARVRRKRRSAATDTGSSSATTRPRASTARTGAREREYGSEHHQYRDTLNTQPSFHLSDPEGKSSTRIHPTAHRPRESTFRLLSLCSKVLSRFFPPKSNPTLDRAVTLRLTLDTRDDRRRS